MFGIKFEKLLKKGLEAKEVKSHTLRTAVRVRELEAGAKALLYMIEEHYSRLEAAESLLIRQGDELERQRKDHERVATRVDNLSKGLVKVHESSGGYWKTASGYNMRIRDMSTDHIKRCLAGNFGGAIARNNMEREMSRRKEEEVWRKKPMPGETRDNFAYAKQLKKEGEDAFVFNNGPDSEPDELAPSDGDFFVGSLYDIPLYIDANTPKRVRRLILDYLSRKGK